MQVITSDLLGIPNKKMNCWELLVEVYRRNGIAIKHYREYVTSMRPPWMGVKEASPWQRVEVPDTGDLLLFCLDGVNCKHVGVYLQGGRFIHSTEACGVCIEELYKYMDRLEGIYRYDTENYR